MRKLLHATPALAVHTKSQRLSFERAPALLRPGPAPLPLGGAHGRQRAPLREGDTTLTSTALLPSPPIRRRRANSQASALISKESVEGSPASSHDDPDGCPRGGPIAVVTATLRSDGGATVAVG